MDALVRSAGDDVLAVGRENHGRLFAERLVESVKPFAVRDTPELHRGIRAGACEHGAVRRKREVENRTFVDVDCADQFRRGPVPKPDDAVVSRRGDDGAIGRKLRVVKRVTSLAVFADERTISNAPKLRRAAESHNARGHEKPHAIGRKMQRVHFAGKSVDPLQHSVIGSIANLHSGTLCDCEHLAIRRICGGGNRFPAARERCDFRDAERFEKRYIVLWPRRAFCDPAFERGKFERRQLRLVLRRHLRFHRALDCAQKQRAFFIGFQRIALLSAPSQCRKSLHTELALAVGIVVAPRAVSAQDRRDFAVVVLGDGCGGNEREK